MPPPIRHARRHGVAYRVMKEADEGLAAQVYLSTRAEEVAQTGWPIIEQHRFLMQQHDAQHRYYRQVYEDAEWLAITVKGDEAGRLYLEERDGEFCIIDIALLGEFRGKGVGGAILRDVLDMAAKVEKRVTIHVEVNNPARSLYDRLGFEKVDEGEERGVYDLLRWTPKVAQKKTAS